MKLKKIVKFLIVIILLGVIGSSIFMFNKWFFNKYQVVKETNEEETEKRNGKEVIKEIIVEESKKEQQTLVNKVKAKEVYYCDKGATLEGNKCVVKVEIPVVKSEKITTNGYIIETILQSAIIAEALEEIDFSSWAVLTEEEINVLTKTLIEELEKGIDEFEKTAKFSCEEMKGTFEQKELSDEDVEYKCTYPAAETKEISHTCLDDTYTLEGDKCKKTIKSSAKVRYECPENYKLEGKECSKNLNE